MSINHKVSVLLLICTVYVSSQIIQSDRDDNNKTTIERPYCFRFTWLGPKYNEESQFKNATCNDVVNGDKSVPCVHPLVVTNNSNTPNTEHIWNEFRDKPTQIGCRLVKGEVCAKFSYTFNGAIENITYLCTKVNIENETSVNSGCYKQIKNGHEIEVCFCESWSGKMPCNEGNVYGFRYLTLAVMIVIYCYNLLM